MDGYFCPQNPNSTFTQLSQIFDPSSDFRFSDQNLSSQFIGNWENNNGGHEIISDDAISSSKNTQVMCNKRDCGSRVAIRTKSDLEIMDDGFKWRKYGKKMMKNSPNPRNYYKCSSEGCNVKKRVERDGEDPSYVITTYEGIHNHHSPTFVYCTTTTNELPHAWSLQPSNSSSHSFP